jgi:methanogenic corrinoid protein MtbC1
MEPPPSLVQLSAAPIFNTKAVAIETSVPPDTFRAWERRYGVPRPQRTQGGHRLYSERDIAIIRWLRDRTAEGMNISHAVLLLGNVLEDDVVLPEATSNRSLDQMIGELTKALIGFDSTTAERIMSEAFSIHQFEKVLLELIQPTMVEIGDLWHNGQINIACEHFATEFIRRKLASLINIFEAVAMHETIVVACAPTELHDIGILYASLFLLRRGYRVVYLGARVPKTDLLEVIAKVKPAMVMISATTIDNVVSLIEVAHAVISQYPHVKFGYGGRIFNVNPELRNNMPGYFLGHDSRELVEQVSTVLAE